MTDQRPIFHLPPSRDLVFASGNSIYREYPKVDCSKVHRFFVVFFLVWFVHIACTCELHLARWSGVDFCESDAKLFKAETQQETMSFTHCIACVRICRLEE